MCFTDRTRLVEKDEKHRVEHSDFDIQLDQGGQAADGISEVDGLGIEVNFFDFGVGTHHVALALERDREHSIGYKIAA